MSFLTQFNQVFFGRPLCLIPSTSHVVQPLILSLSSFRSTCPNHLNLLFLIIKLTGSNPKSSLSSAHYNTLCNNYITLRLGYWHQRADERHGNPSPR